MYKYIEELDLKIKTGIEQGVSWRRNEFRCWKRRKRKGMKIRWKKLI